MFSVGVFITLVPHTMSCMCSVDGLLRSGIAHWFLCVLLTFCHASVSRTDLYEFFLTICHVSPLCTVLYVFCSIVWFVSALRTVLTMLFKIFC